MIETDCLVYDMIQYDDDDDDDDDDGTFNQLTST